MRPSLSDAIQKAIEQAEGIGESTRAIYLQHFHTLVKLAGGSASNIFRFPVEVGDAVRERYSEALTRRALLSTARALPQYLPAIAERFPRASDAYAALIRDDADLNDAQQRALSGRMSERETKSYLPWAEVCSVRDELERKLGPGDPDTLLLSMYVLMEPLRQDYGNIAIHNSEPDRNAARNANFIVAEREGMALVLRAYKTAKHYGEFRRQIPAQLVQLIRASLQRQPRSHLFVNARGEPYEKRNSFVQHTNRRLRAIFGGRPVTVNTLRHSFISSIDFNRRTPGELIATSRMMTHSLNMQQMYRRLPNSAPAPAPAASPPAPASRPGCSTWPTRRPPIWPACATCW